MIYNKIVKDKLAKGADRALLSLIQSEICVDGKPMNDSDAIKKLVQMKKVCDNNVILYKKAEKHEKVVEETVFCGMIEKYLPAAADKGDVEEALQLLGLTKEMKSMGPLMKYLKTKWQVIDGNMVKSVLIG